MAMHRYTQIISALSPVRAGESPMTDNDMLTKTKSSVMRVPARPGTDSGLIKKLVQLTITDIAVGT